MDNIPAYYNSTEIVSSGQSLEQGSPNFTVLSAHWNIKNFFGDACT
jgi:hypothetical protein